MDFDLWITNRISFTIVEPVDENTGDFDTWVTNRMAWWELQTGEGKEPLSIDISPGASYIQVV
jgi:hypothetical protein